MHLGFVHEWITSFAGSERVLAAAAELYPDAPIHALLCDARAIADTPLANRRIETSFIQRLPMARTKYRLYLPLMPMAVEQFDLRGYDVIVSSSHAVAKGALTNADQLHISYVHTPMRYAWDLYHDYLQGSGHTRGLRSMIMRAIMHYLRLWDAQTPQRVDRFIANSHYVARRIAKTYGRRAEVIYPPVDVDRFRADQPREDYYLVVSRLVPYKRVELIVQAFNAMGKKLLVIGDGPERARLAKLAQPNVQLLGEQSDAVIADHMARCRAFVFAAVEDFGIVPVEAQAAGAPVIAYGRGGVRETVVADETGLFYDTPTVEALVEAVRAFERCDRFDPERIRAHAEQFSQARFQREFDQFVKDAWHEFAERVDDQNIQR